MQEYERRGLYGRSQMPMGGRFPEETPLAMAYVPMQTWEEPYDMEEGFCRGTIFPSLDYPFLAAGGEADNGRKG